MRATLDDKRRAVFPPQFSPGDIVNIESQGPDVVIVRRMKPVALPRPKLIRRKGGLVAVGGKPVNNDAVKRLIEDEG